MRKNLLKIFQLRGETDGGQSGERENCGPWGIGVRSGKRWGTGRTSGFQLARLTRPFPNTDAKGPNDHPTQLFRRNIFIALYSEPDQLAALHRFNRNFYTHSVRFGDWTLLHIRMSRFRHLFSLSDIPYFNFTKGGGVGGRGNRWSAKIHHPARSQTQSDPLNFYLGLRAKLRWSRKWGSSSTWSRYQIEPAENSMVTKLWAYRAQWSIPFCGTRHHRQI